MAIGSPPTESGSSEETPLKLSLAILDALGKAGLIIVPERPSPGMIRAGADAGGVTGPVAAAIYEAMVHAEG